MKTLLFCFTIFFCSTIAFSQEPDLCSSCNGVGNAQPRSEEDSFNSWIYVTIANTCKITMNAYIQFQQNGKWSLAKKWQVQPGKKEEFRYRVGKKGEATNIPYRWALVDDNCSFNNIQWKLEENKAGNK